MPAGAITFTGTVTNIETDLPIGGVVCEVDIIEYEDGSIPHYHTLTATTDINGVYTCSFLCEYTDINPSIVIEYIRFSADWYFPEDIYINTGISWTTTYTYTRDAALYAGGTIGGRVVDETGQPLTTGIASVESNRDEEEFYAKGEIDGDGYYDSRLSNEYDKLAVSGIGTANVYSAYTQHTPVEVSITPFQHNIINLHVKVHGNVSGVVVDNNGKTLEGVKLTFLVEYMPEDVEVYVPNPIYTNSSGEWSAEGLRFGITYIVGASLEGYAFSEPYSHGSEVHYYEKPFPTNLDPSILIASFGVTDDSIDFVGTLIPIAEKRKPIFLKTVNQLTDRNLMIIADPYNYNFKTLSMFWTKTSGVINFKKPIAVGQVNIGELEKIVNAYNSNFRNISSQINISFKYPDASSIQGVVNAYNDNFRNLEAYLNKKR